MSRFKVGDTLELKYIPGFEVRREITEVRETGYQWKYYGKGPVINGKLNSFRSEDIPLDPFLKIGWNLIDPKTGVVLQYAEPPEGSEAWRKPNG
jgi:hypothetical protein